jgi:endonuclease YncB( thermonuclease family)
LPPIEVIDGDSVRFERAVCRFVGLDTPERGERRLAAAATTRLRTLLPAAMLACG